MAVMHTVYENNTPVRFEFVFNSNDSLKTKITNTEINKYELKIQQYRKQQKI